MRERGYLLEDEWIVSPRFSALSYECLSGSEIKKSEATEGCRTLSPFDIACISNLLVLSMQPVSYPSIGLSNLKLLT